MKETDWMNLRATIRERSRITVVGSLMCANIFLASCGGSEQPAPDAVKGGEAIEKLLAEMIEKANVGDIEAVMSNFADDAVAMPSGEMPVFGTRLIRPRIQALFDQSRLFIFLTSEETKVSGDFAFARGYISGKINPKSAAPERYVEQTEYLAVLQKDSRGSWKIARLIWHPMEPTNLGPVT